MSTARGTSPILLTVTLVFFLHFVPSQGFYALKHGDITRIALENTNYTFNAGTEVYTPAKWAVENIINAVLAVDHRDQVQGESLSQYHFEDGLVFEGTNLLTELKAQFVSILRPAAAGSGITAALLQQAHSYLGRAIHMTQDFYAHTNWVELGQTATATQLGLGSLSQPVASTGCVASEPWTLSTSSITTSHYFVCDDTILAPYTTPAISFPASSPRSYVIPGNGCGATLARGSSASVCPGISKEHYTSSDRRIGSTATPTADALNTVHLRAANIARSHSQDIISIFLTALGSDNTGKIARQAVLGFGNDVTVVIDDMGASMGAQVSSLGNAAFYTGMRFSSASLVTATSLGVVSGPISSTSGSTLNTAITNAYTAAGGGVSPPQCPSVAASSYASLLAGINAAKPFTSVVVMIARSGPTTTAFWSQVLSTALSKHLSISVIDTSACTADINLQALVSRTGGVYYAARANAIGAVFWSLIQVASSGRQLLRHGYASGDLQGKSRVSVGANSVTIQGEFTVDSSGGDLYVFAGTSVQAVAVSSFQIDTSRAGNAGVAPDVNTDAATRSQLFRNAAPGIYSYTATVPISSTAHEIFISAAVSYPTTTTDTPRVLHAAAYPAADRYGQPRPSQHQVKVGESVPVMVMFTTPIPDTAGLTLALVTGSGEVVSSGGARIMYHDVTTVFTADLNTGSMPSGVVARELYIYITGKKAGDGVPFQRQHPIPFLATSLSLSLSVPPALAINPATTEVATLSIVDMPAATVSVYSDSSDITATTTGTSIPTTTNGRSISSTSISLTATATPTLPNALGSSNVVVRPSATVTISVFASSSTSFPLTTVTLRVLAASQCSCGGNGQCMYDRAVPVCQCDTGYTGTNCDQFIGCLGTPTQCSGHGACSPATTSGQQGTCQCFSGWRGNTCADATGSDGVSTTTIIIIVVIIVFCLVLAIFLVRWVMKNNQAQANKQRRKKRMEEYVGKVPEISLAASPSQTHDMHVDVLPELSRVKPKQRPGFMSMDPKRRRRGTPKALRPYIKKRATASDDTEDSWDRAIGTAPLVRIPNERLIAAQRARRKRRGNASSTSTSDSSGLDIMQQDVYDEDASDYLDLSPDAPSVSGSHSYSDEDTLSASDSDIGSSTSNGSSSSSSSSSSGVDDGGGAIVVSGEELV